MHAVKEPVAGKAIQHWKRSASQWRARVRVGEGRRLRQRFWQPGGNDRNIPGSPALRTALAYMHGKLVRRGLAV